MIDKYQIFRSLLDFCTNGVGDVTDADMNYFDGGILIVADDGSEQVEVRVNIKKKEDSE